MKKEKFSATEWMGTILMRKNNIGYLIREGIRGIFLHGFMSFAAICVTVACLLIMGSFSLILFNLNLMVQKVEQENEILVYIDDTYSEEEARSVGSQINMIANVNQSDFMTRQQALDDFVEEQENFAGLDAGTLRDRFVVSLTDNSLMKQSVQEIEQIEGVAEVAAHYEVAEGFIMVQKVLNVASTAIISILMVVSLFIISNTVKLAMYDRKDEIAIMRMVGATNSFIRWPFVVEGFLLGAFGATTAFFLEWGCYDFLASKIQQIDTANLFIMVPFAEVLPIMIPAFAIAGFVVGVFGSLMSIRKFLHV